MPALARAAGQVATPQIRNMGTLGGNLCLDTRCTYYNQSLEWRQAISYCMKAPGSTGGHACTTPTGDAICWVATSSPRCWAVSSTDTAPALIALGARVTLVSADGERDIPLEELYADDGMAYLTKRPDEILTAVRLAPAEPGWRSTYWKLRRRGSFDFPVLGVAAALRFAEGGVVTDARVVLGAVASRPVLVPEASALVGRDTHRRRGRGRRRRRRATTPRPSTTPISRTPGGRRWCGTTWRGRSRSSGDRFGRLSGRRCREGPRWREQAAQDYLLGL